MSDFYNYEYANVPVGKLVLSQIVWDQRDSCLDFLDIKDRALKLAMGSIALYEEVKLIILKNSIDFVYVWNGRRCSDGPVVYAAKHLPRKSRHHYYLRPP
jgi:hypothetical protein